MASEYYWPKLRKNVADFVKTHTVVSLPYYPIQLKEKNHIKAPSKVRSLLSEVQKGASILQTLPKILTAGNKWPSRPFGGSKNSVFYKVKGSSGLLRSL